MTDREKAMQQLRREAAARRLASAIEQLTIEFENNLTAAYRMTAYELYSLPDDASSRLMY